jgi:NDMA-dependent alcohol dehydrogenase
VFVNVRGAVIEGVGQDWKVRDIQLDGPKRGEVLVKLHVAGVCHSDDHYGSGDLVPTPEMVAAAAAAGIEIPDSFPLVGGHEGAGEVVEVGPEVSTLKVGDHVASSFVPACGVCRFCVSGQSGLCDVGADLFSPLMITDHTQRRWVDGTPLTAMCQLGTFAEYSVAAATSWIKVDDDLPWNGISMVSCGVSTGFGAATERAGTKPGDVVVVIGVGGVGMNAVQGARIAGAGVIVAVDPVAYKREKAPEFGATHVSASIDDAIVLVRELTRGLMADRVIVTPGVLHTDIAGAGLTLTRKGGTCVLVAVTPMSETTVPMSLTEFVSYGKELKGCIFGNLNPRYDMQRLLSLYRSGLLKLDELGTKTYQLDDINSAFHDMAEGNTLRGLITFD